MATKTSLISAVNAQITAVIDDIKHRQSMLELINEIYPTPIVDTHLTTNAITVVGSNFEYELTFTKIGRLVHINGFISNVSGSILNIEDIATITNTEFNPFDTFVLQGHNSSGQTLNIQVETGQIVLASTFGVGTTFFINQSYPVIN